jgi:RNA polymerase sigma-70 factor (ECF subfamily)
VNSLALSLMGSAATAADRNLTDEERLIRRFLRGRDPQLFAELIRPYEAPVHRLVASTLGAALVAEADDCTQEIFLHVYRKLPVFRFESRFSTWLYRIARNRAIDHLRRPRHRRPHVGEQALQSLRAEGHDALLEVAAKDRARRLRALVAGLPEPQRSIVHLFYWMERPVDEIARSLDCPVSTVKSHLHRARKRLGNLWEQE